MMTLHHSPNREVLLPAHWSLVLMIFFLSLVQLVMPSSSSSAAGLLNKITCVRDFFLQF